MKIVESSNKHICIMYEDICRHKKLWLYNQTDKIRFHLYLYLTIVLS